MNNRNAIPNFITAASPSGLRRLMFIKAAKYGGYLKFSDIQFAEVAPGRSAWIAWFIEEISDQEALKLADPAADVTKAGGA